MFKRGDNGDMGGKCDKWGGMEPMGCPGGGNPAGKWAAREDRLEAKDEAVGEAALGRMPFPMVEEEWLEAAELRPMLEWERMGSMEDSRKSTAMGGVLVGEVERLLGWWKSSPL